MKEVMPDSVSFGVEYVIAAFVFMIFLIQMIRYMIKKDNIDRLNHEIDARNAKRREQRMKILNSTLEEAKEKTRNS